MGYIDLHCHWVAGIDDGAPTIDEGLDMLRALRDIGFSHVMATPHMRTGMFDNDKHDLLEAYRRSADAVAKHNDLPSVGLSSEHHLDDIVFQNLIDGEGLPYPPSQSAALVEFPNERFPLNYEQRMFELRLKKIRPVLAHPERYRPVWKDTRVLDKLLDGGTLLLLDVAALDGKYGRKTKKAALRMLADGYYYAACSDAHRTRDVKSVAKGIRELRKIAGDDEAEFMLAQGPHHIIHGTVAD